MIVAPYPLVMGVLNVTPDSFSDGGRFATLDAALGQAHALLSAGAQMLDIGGESTRPGAASVSADEEMLRVLPVIKALSSSGVDISIDTSKAEVAREAVAVGASMWNDITALRGGPDSVDVAAELGCSVVLMHMQGRPATMQHDPYYCDVVQEVADFLQSRVEAAIAGGVARERIWLDPGIGFGKRLDHNLALLARLDQLTKLGFPLLLGVSRKRTVAYIDPTARDPNDRLGGSLAMALQGAAKGVSALRVHDVRETVQALKVWAALCAAERTA